MGEATDQTRLAIDAQRAQLTATAAQLRDAVDLPKKFKQNPLPFVAVGAGAIFLLAGGPMRVARLVRRRVMPTRTEKAYDGLPKTLQKWVDEIAGGVGPRTEEARESLAAEFVRWRHDPKKDKNATLYESISYRDVMLEELGVMDQTAVTLCKENNLPLIVLNIHRPGAVASAIRGEIGRAHV